MVTPSPALLAIMEADIPRDEKVYQLARFGLSIPDIARALSLRFQIVQQVLDKRPVPRQDLPHERVQLGEDGSLVIPPAFLEALELHPGDQVVLRLEEGELRVSVRDLAPHTRALGMGAISASESTPELPATTD
jgi:antitoxin component of MazEF toxin-antitoxin module